MILILRGLNPDYLIEAQNETLNGEAYLEKALVCDAGTENSLDQGKRYVHSVSKDFA